MYVNIYIYIYIYVCDSRITTSTSDPQVLGDTVGKHRCRMQEKIEKEVAEPFHLLQSAETSQAELAGAGLEAVTAFPDPLLLCMAETPTHESCANLPTLAVPIRHASGCH